jgi:hypothetical protein
VSIDTVTTTLNPMKTRLPSFLISIITLFLMLAECRDALADPYQTVVGRVTVQVPFAQPDWTNASGLFFGLRDSDGMISKYVPLAFKADGSFKANVPFNYTQMGICVRLNGSYGCRIFKLPFKRGGTDLGIVPVELIDDSAVGSEAPDFTMKSYDFTFYKYREVDLQSLRGNYVLLTFFSSEDCNALRTWLNQEQIYHDFVEPSRETTESKTGLNMMFVSLDSTSDRLLKTVPTPGWYFCSSRDNDEQREELMRMYGVSHRTKSILIDPEGKIITITSSDYEFSLRAAITAALKKIASRLSDGC